MKPALTCPRCGKVFVPRPHQRLYCSRACSGLRGARQTECGWCHRVFWVGRADGKKHVARFCSRTCAGLSRGKAPQEVPSPEDLAWAAGFYEGEGSVVRVPPENVCASIGQKDRWVLDRFSALFGGRIHQRRRSNRPSVLIPNPPAISEWYVWSVTGPRAKFLLGSIYPYLSPRRKAQIDAATAHDFSAADTPMDQHWAAGLYEGEGTAHRTTSPAIRVKQKDPWILMKLQEMFGGTMRKEVNCGFEIHTWSIYGPRARRFLHAIMPRLSPWRAEQARRALGKAG